MKRQKAEIEREEKEARELLIKAGVETLQGFHFKAEIKHIEVTRIDYPALIERLAPSPQMLRHYQNTKEEIRVLVKPS